MKNKKWWTKPLIELYRLSDCIHVHIFRETGCKEGESVGRLVNKSNKGDETTLWPMGFEWWVAHENIYGIKICWRPLEICFLEIVRLKMSDTAAKNITITKYTYASSHTLDTWRKQSVTDKFVLTFSERLYLLSERQPSSNHSVRNPLANPIVSISCLSPLPAPFSTSVMSSVVLIPPSLAVKTPEPH